VTYGYSIPFLLRITVRYVRMVRLPASLERRLQELFPRVREREKFVAEVIERSLQVTAEGEVARKESVGGTLHLFTDGGSRGNPGQAAIGCVLEDPSTGKVIREHMERIGITTNNIAEYRALIEGLRLARPYHPNTLLCSLDSELVVKQLSGEYRVKMHSLEPLVQEIRALSEQFPHVSFVHIPRDDNHRADALVNRALDELPDPHYEPPARA